MSVAELYRHVAVRILEAHRNLDILSSAHSSMLLELPS